MALSNWYNSNIVIDMENFTELDRNIELFELNDIFNFEIYKNYVQIKLNTDDINIAPQLKQDSILSFDNETGGEINIGTNTVFVESGSKPSEAVYVIYNWKTKILLLGICGIDDFCHNCGVISIGKKLQDVYLALLGVKTISIIEKDKDNKLLGLINSMTVYNQGGRKYPNLLAPEERPTINEYE